MQNNMSNTQKAQTPISLEADGSVIFIVRLEHGWLAIDKPAKMSIHNEPGKDLRSTVDAFLKSRPDLAEKTAYRPDYGLNPVHRIDLETSGLIVLATNPDAFKFISEQFENRAINKTYQAILHGEFADGKKEGEWTWPLANKPGGRQSPQGTGKLLPCRTGFRVLDQSAHYVLVACKPFTGRIHQIRRHAKLAGHPVVGDPRYGSPRSLKFLKENSGFDRMGLHAMELRIVPPGRKVPETIRSVGFPDELARFFERDKHPERI